MKDNDNKDYESSNDYEDLYDADETFKEDENLDLENESEYDHSDVQGLTKLYYEYSGKTLPEQYKDYANKSFISGTWAPMTCHVIKALDDIGWKSMSAQDKCAYFELIAEYAKFDEKYYQSNYYHIVYSIAYQIVWAACKRLRSDNIQANIDDIVSDTLIGIASDAKQIGRYDPTYSPITYLDRLVKTRISNAYYKNTEARKKLTTIRHDLEHVKNLSKNITDDVNWNILNTTGIYQLYMESKRSQNPVSHIELDAVLHAATNNTLELEYNQTDTTTETLFDKILSSDEMYDFDNETIRHIKNILERRYHDRASEYYNAFIWYLEGNENDKQFARENKDHKWFQMAMDVKKLLANNHTLKKIGRRNGHSTGSDTKLGMNDNHISDDILQDIINSDIDL